MYRQAVLSRRAPPSKPPPPPPPTTSVVRVCPKTKDRFQSLRPKPKIEKTKKPFEWTPNLDYFAKHVYRDMGAQPVDILFAEFKKHIEDAVEKNEGKMPPDQHLYLALFCRAASFQYIEVMRDLVTRLKHRMGQKKQYDTWKAFTPFHTVLYPDPSAGYDIGRMLEAIGIIQECSVGFSPLTKTQGMKTLWMPFGKIRIWAKWMRTAST